MKSIRKSSLTAETEKELRTAILAGRFGATLPGFRVLAKVLGVSPPTVAEAVKALMAEGLVRSEGPRRRMAVVSGGLRRESSSPAHGRVLWFATSASFENAVHGSSEVLACLPELLAGTGWQVKHRILSYGHSESRTSQWDNMADAEMPDAMVAWTGRPALAEWALARGLRTLFLGGVRESFPIPMLAVKTAEMVDRAACELLGQGHRRLVLPMCNRAPDMVTSVRGVLARRLKGGASAALDAAPVSSYEGGQVMEAMVEQALAERAPTGWIFFDWREFLAASCVFRDRGLAVPRDLSVIVLSHDPSMDWYRPRPAHFRFPLDRFGKGVAEWVLGRAEWTGSRHLPPEWVPGETLGAAPG